MKKTLKKTLALLLAVMMTFSCFVTAVSAKEYFKYENYVLLGDSSASGFKDGTDITGTFTRVDTSYAAIVADTLGSNFFPRACQGFRTVELRYIFEDDFQGDDYLFAHTDPDMVKAMIPQIREEVANADLITLGIGGNDFGAYLGWVISDILEGESDNAELVAAIRQYMEDNQVAVGNETIEGLLELVYTLGYLDEFIAKVPEALVYTLTAYTENWDKMIEDIYALNPDVELLVLGLYNNSITATTDPELDEAKIYIQNLLVDLGNKPMTDGLEKFDYTFVDTNGATCYLSHPDDEGQKYIANKILEALPDATFPYTDVSRTDSCYKAVEYMYQTGAIDGATATEFAPNEAFTWTQLKQALTVLGYETDVEDGGEISIIAFAIELYNRAQKDSLTDKINAFIFLLKTVFSGLPISAITKGAAAEKLYEFINL